MITSQMSSKSPARRAGEIIGIEKVEPMAFCRRRLRWMTNKLCAQLADGLPALNKQIFWLGEDDPLPKDSVFLLHLLQGMDGLSEDDKAILNFLQSTIEKSESKIEAA
jgi:hypothetical protein